MLKKAGIVAATTAALLMAGGTAAFADWEKPGKYNAGSVWYPGHYHHAQQTGLVNTGGIDVLDEVTIPLCLNDINVALVVVDLLSPSGQPGSCNAGVVSDNHCYH